MTAAARMVFRGTMRGHTDVITAITMPTENNLDMAVTASHDKSVIVWRLIKDGVTYGVPRHRLTGHTNVVQDVALSNYGRSAVSASWDSTLGHWNIDAGTLVLRQGVAGHPQPQVLSVAFSADNFKIASALSDGTINITTINNTNSDIAPHHTDRVSCVRFSPNTSSQHVLVSCSWDQTLKVWDSSSNNLKLMHTLTGHSDRVNTVAVARDGTRCVSGGNDGLIMLWDMIQGKRLCSLETGYIIYAMSMNPARDWVSVGTEESVMIWDLERESVIHELKTEEAEERVFNPYEEDGIIYCTSLSWSNDGSTLFCGYTDGVVRVWEIIDD
ncbi:hypothetical protein RIF29_22134 [Crotalaria pallida]|uniref:Guanine nucleotide-binding protein subunit beta-like protein n=1 Tax=Crotalaria pallida TaxID=3830 RepID=A0AAN9I6K9_CROPI